MVVNFEQSEKEQKFKEIFKYNPSLYVQSKEGTPSEFLKFAAKSFSIEERIKELQSGHCPIQIKDFENLELAPTDIFIKLGDDKYVKVFHRYQEFTNVDLSKYEDKGVNSLWVKENDFGTFIQYVAQGFINKIELGEHDLSKWDLPKECHQRVYQIVNAIGLDEKSLKLTGAALGSVLTGLSGSSLENIIMSTLKNDDYITEHSLLVAYIACAVSQATEWNNPENDVRLSMAALFHDIKCVSPEVAQIISTESAEFKNLPYRDQKNVFEHPKLAADLLKEVDGIPMGVDKIILNHEERPDGTGFPRGLDYRHFDPLTGIFVLSHEIVDFIYTAGFYRDNIYVALRELTDRYPKSFFPKIIEGLYKSFKINYTEEKPLPMVG
jgi:HD-GYP domain-containing protein (c-di-GMP phosphodiesterase class II)